MNRLQTNLLNTLVGAAVAIGAAGTTGVARADAFAQSILVIDNLRLLHPNGTSYTASDFQTLAGASLGHATGELNGLVASDVQTGSNIDIAQQGVGMLRAENSFSPFLQAAGAAASFGHADQHMSGSLISTTDGAAGALIRSRADASLAGAGAAEGATFTFALGADEFMTISFDARAFTQVYTGDQVSSAASAYLAWSVSVLDLTTGATVFSYQPDQLNGMSHVSRTDGLAGATTYDPGLMSFSATTVLLAAGNTYQVMIAQFTFANAQQSQQMPEPGTLAAFGAGLLAMAALSRRRRG